MILTFPMKGASLLNRIVDLIQAYPLSLKTHELSVRARRRTVKLGQSSIVYIHKGSGLLRTADGAEFRLEPGTCLSFKGAVSFDWSNDNDMPLRLTLLQYRTIGIVGDRSGLNARWEEPQPYPEADRLPPALAAQAGRLLENGKPGRDNDPRMHVLMAELSLLLREAESLSASPSEDQGMLRKTMEYMRAHYMKPLQMAALAKMAGLTPSSFSRGFKQLAGKTPGAFLTQLRIERAKSLMREPDMNFKQISGIVGFQDELYFSRVFKKQEGVSPTIYMKRNQQRVAIVSGLNLQDQMLALGIRPIAAPSFPAFYGTASGFPVYLDELLKATKPINAERTIAADEVIDLSPDLILKADFIRNWDAPEWNGAANMVHLQERDSWESYQRDIASQLNKERELERIERQVKKAERAGARALSPFSRQGSWTIVRLLPGDCRVYGTTGHAFTDLFYRDLHFQPDDGLDYRSYLSRSLEELVAMNPDRLLIIWSDPDTVAAFEAHPLWREMRAAREQRVYFPNSKQWDPWGPIGRQYMIREMTNYFLSRA